MNPPLIRRGTRLEPQPAPWSSTGGKGASFLLRGDKARLQALCQRTLAGAAWPCEPMDEYVMLTVQRIEGFASTHPSVAADERVAYDYHEAAFWVAVRNTQTGEEGFILPYVFHDRTVPTSLGRELWGLAKESADVTFDTVWGGLGARGLVDALAIQAAGQRPRLQRVVELQPALPAFEAGLTPSTIDLAIGEALSELLEKLGVSGAALRLLIKRRFNFLLLRQFPSPDAPGAGLQQVLRLPVELDSSVFSVRPYVVPHRMRLACAPSHPIAADFGFALDAQDRMTVSVGVQADFAFTLGAGTPVP